MGIPSHWDRPGVNYGYDTKKVSSGGFMRRASLTAIIALCALGIGKFTTAGPVGSIPSSERTEKGGNNARRIAGAYAGKCSY